MPKKTKAVEPVADEQPKKTKAVEFDVVDSAGNIKRTYKSVDYDDAEDLANQFAKKFGFKVQ